MTEQFGHKTIECYLPRAAGQRRLMAAILAGSLALAACGGSAAVTSSSPAASSPAATASTAAKPSPAASSSTAASPSTAASSSAASGPIKVGVLEPLTGSFASTGKDNEDGFNLYLSAVSDTAAGRKIEPVFADTQGQAQTAVTKAKALIENDKVAALMGLTPTPECYAVAGVAKSTHTPLMITANCSAEDLFTQHGSPYVVRFTQSNLGVAQPGADWAYKQGYRKAVLFTSDYGGGLEQSDAFAAVFIQEGGTIVQELHPALGAADYGPFLAQLNRSADVIWTFLPGANGLHFGLQYHDYTSGSKTQVMEAFADITAGPNLQQLKDKAVGLVASNVWSEALDTPQNQQFMKAFHAKYPGRLLSKDVVQGYVGAQILEEAVKKVNGKVADTNAFMQALYNMSIDTAKGPVRLSANHDVVQNYYVYRTVARGQGFGQQLLQTYKNVSDLGPFTAKQVANLKIGTRKGQWVGMTKQKLDQILNQ